jgi:hypothetical protein
MHYKVSSVRKSLSEEVGLMMSLKISDVSNMMEIRWKTVTGSWYCR